MKAILVFLFALWATLVEAQLPHGVPDFCTTPTVTSVQNGPWESGPTWSGGQVPAADARVKVNHAVTLNGVSTTSLASVCVAGKLTFNPATSTSLKVGTLLVYETGELDVQQTDPTKIAEIVIADRPVTDADQYEIGLLSLGKVTLRGAAKTAFVRLTTQSTAGATTLQVEPTSGWRAGDSLALPGTQQWFLDVGPWPQEWEERALSAVNPAGTTLTVPALSFAHKGAQDLNGVIDSLPHVANLTRNVVIRSENPSGTRGHVMFMHRANVDVRYVEFRDLGRTTTALLGPTNHIGRYALHIHFLYGPIAPTQNGYQFTLIGNAITGASKWGITVHESHYGLIQDNVIYNAQGAGVMTEAGNESFNVFDHNLSFRNWGTGEERGDAREGFGEWGFEGSCFWFRGPNNRVTNNVCANSNSFGYVVMPVNLGPMRVPNFKGADTTVAGQYTSQPGQRIPILEWANNEVYAAAGGLTIWDVMANCCTEMFEGPESVIRNQRTWHVGRYGYYGYGHNRLTIDGWYQRGDTTWLWSQYVNPFGIWFGDYLTRHQLIRNADIQGVRVGIVAPYKAGDTADIYGFTPGVTRIEDAFLRTQFGVTIAPQYAVTGGGNSLPPRRTELHNVRHQPMNIGTLPWGNVQRSVAASFSIDQRNANIIVPDEIYVTKHQGVAGDDFRVYYQAQAPSYIVPQSQPNLVGSPVADLTNTQTLAQFGIAIAGSIAPCATSRPDVEGFVCASAQQAPTLTARFSRGQTFLTWPETGASSYEVRRDGVLVTTVPADSGFNRYTGQRFVVEDLGAPLAAGIGLFVDTPHTSGTVSYSVTDGTATFDSGPVSVTATTTPGAVLLAIDTSPGFPVYKYFAWEDSATWDNSWGYYGHRFNVSVKGPLVSGTLYPLVLDLHGAGVNTYEEPPAWVDIPAVGVYLFPVARTFTQGNTDPYSGNQSLPNHFGQPLPDRVVGSSEARYLRYIRWISADPQFQVDPNRIYAKGGSMGGGGALRIALRHPEVFASAAPSISYGSPGEWNSWTGFTGKPVAGVASIDWDDWESAQWLIENHVAIGLATTPIVHTYRKDDNIIPQTAKPALLAATEANHLPYIARWQNGGHNVFWLSGSADFLRYKRNEAYPAFSNASSSDNATTAQEGQRNLHLDWSSSLHSLGAGTAISDTASEFAITLASLQGTQTADVTIRNAQQFHPASGQQIAWTNACGGIPLQQGATSANPQGLVTLPLTLTTSSCRLTLSLGLIPPPTLEAPTNLRIIDPPTGPPLLHAMSRSFTGSENDHLYIGDHANVDITGTTWTVAVWAKYSGSGGKAVAKWDDNAGAFQYLIELGSTVTAAMNDGTVRVISGSATTNDNAWHLIVIRQNGTGAGSFTLRVDGASDGSQTTSGGPSNTAATFKIGAGGDINIEEGPYTGLLSRVAVWKTTALSDGQADSLLTASPNNIGVSPDFYVISSVNEVVDYANGISITDNGTVYSSDEPFVEGGGGGGGALLQGLLIRGGRLMGRRLIR